MKTCKDMALWLISQGCSVIPLMPKDKRPLARVLPKGAWGEFSKRIATQDEVNRWFELEPNANIGLVCGAISGLVAVDVDGENGQAWFKENMPKPNWFQYTSSAHKFHAFYKHPRGGVVVPPAVRITDQIDVRGDGSYVVFAPSIHPSGAQYSLKPLAGFTGIDSLVPVPDIKLRTIPDGTTEVDNSAIEIRGDTSLEAQAGERNQALTSHCGRMYARGCNVEEVLVFALGWNAVCCKPPLPQKEVETIVRSMSKTHMHRNPQALNSGGVERWVQLSNGEFMIADIYRDLGIQRPEDKNACQQTIQDLLAHRIIERCGKRTGWFRKVENTIERIDLNEPEAPKIEMWLPFNLHRDVIIQPKNVVVVAGETNSGKTGFLFNLVFMNLDNHKFRYLSSEMTPNEIKNRIDAFGRAREDWTSKVDFVERSSNFADAIDPDGINIIDFLEVHDNFYAIGAEIKKIFDALKGGVVFIAIQKRTGEMFGRGGEFTLEKARLGLSLFTHGRKPHGIVGSVKVTKAKNFIDGRNPDGKEQFYSLSNGYYYDNSPIAGIGFSRGFAFYSKKERDKITNEIECYCKDLSEKQRTGNAENFY